MNSVHACVFLLSIALVACSQASSPPDGEGLPAGLDMLGVLDRLAEDRADVFEPVMISTYDRSGGNLDFDIPTHTVLEEDSEGRTVLFDADGPGVVTRIWLTHFSVRAARAEGADTLSRIPGDILFFFDHEDTPRIEMTLQDFSGSSPRNPFPTFRSTPFACSRVT